MNCSCGDIYTATIVGDDDEPMYFYEEVNGCGQFVYA
jgi:hypothetical protein